jgi:hypothetical protein
MDRRLVLAGIVATVAVVGCSGADPATARLAAGSKAILVHDTTTEPSGKTPTYVDKSVILVGFKYVPVGTEVVIVSDDGEPGSAYREVTVSIRSSSVVPEFTRPEGDSFVAKVSRSELRPAK